MLEDIIKLSQRFLEIKTSPYRRYFIQTVDLSHRLIIIIGARGVGKTTTLIQHLLDQVKGDRYDPRILYVQADHLAIGSMTLYEIAEQFEQLGGKYLALDEIHRYPNWSQELKSINDTFPSLQVIASGSSALEIQKGTHDLSRRSLQFDMAGLSFREYLELQLKIELPTLSLEEVLESHPRKAGEIVSQLAELNEKVLPRFEEYLKTGFYPYTREFPNKGSYFMTLEQNLHTTLESDLVAIHPELSGNSIKKIKQLLIYIAASVPFSPSWAQIKTIVDIGDIRTLKTYFSYLERAQIIRSVEKATQKLRAVGSVAKVYLANPNQLAALSQGKENRGTVRETFFLSMLSFKNEVAVPAEGDFLVNGRYLFEVGGRKKTFEQIRDLKHSFLALDGIETSAGSKVPLWLFGFLY